MNSFAFARASARRCARVFGGSNDAPRTRARILTRPGLQPTQPLLQRLHARSEIENELHATSRRVINRLRLGTLHARKIRCNKQESLPKAPRLNGSVLEGLFASVRRRTYLSRDKYVDRVRPFDARDNTVDVPMSVSFHRGGWEVRWRDADGRRRARRFAIEEAARSTKRALLRSSRASCACGRRGRDGGSDRTRVESGCLRPVIADRRALTSLEELPDRRRPRRGGASRPLAQPPIPIASARCEASQRVRRRLSQLPAGCGPH